MGLLDFSYRLKPTAGDTDAHNEVGGAQALSGGTITLVDLGSGVMAWRFTGANSYATITSRTLAATGSTTGGGVTMAIRVAATTELSVTDGRMFNFGATTDQTSTGLQLRRASSAGVMYGAFRESGGTAISGSNATIGTTMKTHVFRLRTNVVALASTEVIDWWYTGGGAGPTPDTTSTGGNLAAAHVLQYLHVNPQSIATYDVRDIVIWPEELSDSDCDAIRDDIDAALSLPAPTFTGTIPTLTGTEGVALAAQSPTIASYFTGTGITYTVSTALPAGLSINSGTGVISGTPSTGDDWSGYVTATNGGGSDDSNTFDITISAAGDVTPPTLSSPAGTGGTLVCSGTVSTNESGGTLYVVATASATAPTATQVEAGQDHTGAAALRVVSQAVSATGSQAVASGSVTAGTRYLHFMHKDAAGNKSTVASSASFVVSAAGTAPSINTQPSNQSATVGGTATFSVVASGSGTLTYQWRLNGSNISGATSSSYTTPTLVLGDDGGLYSVVVTGDTSPPATSSNATLTVTEAAAPGAYLIKAGITVLGELVILP